MNAYAIFRWGYPRLLFEHTAEMLGVIESQTISDLCNPRTCCKCIFRSLDNILADIVARRIAGRFLDHIAEIISRHTQFIGAVLDGWQTFRQLSVLLEIIPQQTVELHQHIRVFQLAGKKLPVVKTLAEIQYQTDVVHNNRILHGIALPYDFILKLTHQRNERIMFLVGHVQSFIDAVIEKGVILYRLFQSCSMQQVGMKKQRPARQVYPLAIVFLAAYLTGATQMTVPFL